MRLKTLEGRVYAHSRKKKSHDPQWLVLCLFKRVFDIRNLGPV